MWIIPSNSRFPRSVSAIVVVFPMTPSHWPQSQCRRLPASLSSTVPSTLGVVEFRRGTRGTRGTGGRSRNCAADWPKSPKLQSQNTCDFGPKCRAQCVAWPLKILKVGSQFGSIHCGSYELPHTREASRHGVLSGYNPFGHHFS